MPVYGSTNDSIEKPPARRCNIWGCNSGRRTSLMFSFSKVRCDLESQLAGIAVAPCRGLNSPWPFALCPERSTDEGIPVSRCRHQLSDPRAGSLDLREPLDCIVCCFVSVLVRRDPSQPARGKRSIALLLDAKARRVQVHAACCSWLEVVSRVAVH